MRRELNKYQELLLNKLIDNELNKVEDFVVTDLIYKTHLSKPITVVMEVPPELVKPERMRLNLKNNVVTSIEPLNDKTTIKLTIQENSPALLFENKVVLPKGTIFEVEDGVGSICRVGQYNLSLKSPPAEIPSTSESSSEPVHNVVSSYPGIHKAFGLLGDSLHARAKIKIDQIKRALGTYKKQGFSSDPTHETPEYEPSVETFIVKPRFNPDSKILTPVDAHSGLYSDDLTVPGHFDYDYHPISDEHDLSKQKVPLSRGSSTSKSVKFKALAHPESSKGPKTVHPLIHSAISEMLDSNGIKKHNIDTIYINRNMKGERAAIVKLKDGTFSIIDHLHKRQHEKEKQKEKDAVWEHQVGKNQSLRDAVIDKATETLHFHMARVNKHRDLVDSLVREHNKLKKSFGADSKTIANNESKINEEILHLKRLEFIRNRNAAALYQIITGQRPGENQVSRTKKGIFLAGAYSLRPMHLQQVKGKKAFRVRYVGKKGVDNHFSEELDNPALYEFFKTRDKEIDRLLKGKTLYNIKPNTMVWESKEGGKPKVGLETRKSKLDPKYVKKRAFPYFENVTSEDAENFFTGKHPNKSVPKLHTSAKSVDLPHLYISQNKEKHNPAYHSANNLREWLTGHTHEGVKRFPHLKEDYVADPYTFRRIFDKERFQLLMLAKLFSEVKHDGTGLDINMDRLKGEDKDKYITSILSQLYPGSQHSPPVILRDYLGKADAERMTDDIWDNLRKIKLHGH